MRDYAEQCQSEFRVKLPATVSEYTCVVNVLSDVTSECPSLIYQLHSFILVPSDL